MGNNRYEVIEKEKIKSQIYNIRGHRVMLDSDVAFYFGVTTGNLNKAMKRNVVRFPKDFCFQLSNEEISRFQSGISSLYGSHGGRRTLPYVYTEQGVAMLTSCLHTDKAIKASIQIMEAFVEMSHYLRNSKQYIGYQEYTSLTERQNIIETDVKRIKESMLTRDELTDLMKLFNNSIENEEILIMNGQVFKADLAYENIFRKARNNIMLIDDYISLRTLKHLSSARQNIRITVVSDNKGKNLGLNEYCDYMKEYPHMNISFIRTENKVHDRYIVIDNDTEDMKIYHCGSSIKDTGNRISTIIQIKDISEYRIMLNNLMKNKSLQLK